MTTQTTPKIPEGYRMDARGRLVPEELIRPIDLARDALVTEIVSKAKSMAELLGQLKGGFFADIAAFISLSAEQYGAKVGGDKGNVQLLSFDGKYKVLRAISETLVFDERLQAAKALIDSCLQRWTEGSQPEIKVLIDDAFQVDKSGAINTGRVLSLRRLSIEDEQWQQAMKAIGEAVQVAGSKSYIRVYERIGDTDQYRAINLDLAGA
jgi:hypothetical protein